jgi:hypothetical protein
MATAQQKLATYTDLASRKLPLTVRLGINEVFQTFNLGKIHPAREEGLSGKLASIGGAAAFDT